VGYACENMQAKMHNMSMKYEYEVRYRHIVGRNCRKVGP